MRAKIAVTDADGRVYEGELDLILGSERRDGPNSSGGEVGESNASSAPASPRIDFSLPIRAFMNRYAKGLTGHAAFTALTARLAGGIVGQELKLDVVESEWNKVKGILPGSYAAVYGTRARNQAWVDSPKRGVIVLLPDWAQALGK